MLVNENFPKVATPLKDGIVQVKNGIFAFKPQDGIRNILITGGAGFM